MVIITIIIIYGLQPLFVVLKDNIFWAPHLYSSASRDTKLKALVDLHTVGKGADVIIYFVFNRKYSQQWCSATVVLVPLCCLLFLTADSVFTAIAQTIILTSKHLEGVERYNFAVVFIKIIGLSRFPIHSYAPEFPCCMKKCVV